MSWQDCAQNIRAAAGREMSDGDIMALMEDIQRRADAARRNRPDLSAAELLRQAGKEAAAEAEMAARVEARNRKMNLAKRVARRQFYENAPDILMGLEAKLVGVNTPFAGSRLSVDATQQTLARDLVGGLTTELERAGLYKFIQGGQHERAIARELWELSRPDGEPGSPQRSGESVSGNSAAAQAAGIIHKYQEAARLLLNKEGAWIGQYDGWIARTSHDADLLRRAGFTRWKADIAARLDERSFDGIDDRDGFLHGIYNALVSGIHLTPEGLQGFKDPAFSGPGNLGKRLSQGRKLHFKDDAAWMDYHDTYGGQSLMESITGGLGAAARSVALMREFGTNPRAEFEADIKYLQEVWRDRDPGLANKLREAKWLTNRFDELDGTASRPVNALAAKIGASVRTGQATAKLGGVLASAITDVPLKASELTYQGVGLLESYGDGLIAPLRGRDGVAGREVADLMLAGLDGMIGNINGRFDAANDGVPGTLSKMANIFFRWSGLTYWTDAQRAGAEFIMARHLGRLVGTDHAHLPPATQRMLQMFDISPAEWNALAGLDLVKGNDGRAYLTPDRARLIGDDMVDNLIGDKLDALRGSMLERLDKVVADTGRLESRLDKLNAVLAKPMPGQAQLDAIDIKATNDAYARQLQTVSAIRDKVLALRDAKASANEVLKTSRREIQKLADAEKRITAQALRRLDKLTAQIPKAEARRVEAELAAEKVKATLLERLEEIQAWPDRLEVESAKLRDAAREDLALKIHAYYADRGQYAVLAPGARERAMLRQGTKAGTIEGEALRFVTQFKAFPAAMISKVWGREIHGGNQGLARAAGIVHMMVATTIFGYMAGVLKDLTKGRTPRDASDPSTWGAAFLQGGGAGIYGDFLLGKANRFGNSALETVAGPTLSSAAELVNIWNGARAGDDKKAAALRWAVGNTPFINLFYTRAAMDYLFLHQVQEAMNPGYLRRFEARVQRENGQTFWLRPTQALGVSE